MAQGEVRANIEIIGALADWVIRPPLGEQWLLKRLFSNQQTGSAPNRIPCVGLEVLKEPTFNADFGNDDSPADSINLYEQELNIPVNNSFYFRLRNRASVNASIGYTAIRIK